VRPIIPITAAFACAAASVALLPPESRGLAWLALGLVYLGIATYGVASLGSGLFGAAFTRGSGAHPEVALTFDDGPDPRATPALLDLLRSRGVAAAFFCVGERVRAHPATARRAHEEGHLLGNHSDRHSALTNFLPARALERELTRCGRTLEEITGALPRYYRPPFGITSAALDGVARRLGLEVTGWQVRGLDTSGRSPERVAARILEGVRPGGIIVLHDGGRNPASLVEATRRILDGLESKGLAVVRLDRLRRGQASALEAHRGP